jgi:hypothetical protein
MEGSFAKGFCHDLVDDCGYSTMRQPTKLATKLATKKKLYEKYGETQK